MIGNIVAKFVSPIYLFFIIPHGIIEFIAFFLVAKCSITILKRDYFIFNDIRAVAFSYLLLVISCLIEAYITPNLANILI